MLTKSKSTDVTIPVNKGSAEWRKPLESGRVSASVTEGKKTKEKERYTGCQNRRYTKNAKTHGLLSIL